VPPLTLPSSGKATSAANEANAVDTDNDDDELSVTTDPTELFHRDFGTQTSPSLSRRPSGAGLGGKMGAEKEASTAEWHATRLGSIKANVKELVDSAENSIAAGSTLQAKVTDLNEYLQELRYGAATHYAFGGAGGYGGFGGGVSSGGSAGVGGGYGKGKDDAVESLKAEIRSVKGVFLNVRNFPRQA